MHACKKALLSVALSFLLPFSAMSADDDGTFTITIQGPEVEDTVPQVQSVEPVRRSSARRAVSRQNRSATVNATASRAPSATVNQQSQTVRGSTSDAAQVQQTPARTYSVASGDTIWSVAHRFMPQDRSVNEFQIVASIYRNNPRAFGQGNVNNLLRTTITIPPLAQIARETTDTGSRLLSLGRMTMPPLVNAVNSSVNTAAAPAQNNTPAQNTVQNKPMQSLSDTDIPQYTATETKIKKLQEEEAKKDLSVAIPNNSRGADLDKSKALDQTDGNGASSENAANKTPANVNAMSADLAAAAVDAKSIRIMLDGNKKAIDEKTKVLEQQLAEAMDRMKKTSAATAKTAADSVSTLASQYDNIISGLQQDIIEIKGNISKLSQDNDRMREMLLANDEKIEDMQLQLSQFSVSTPTSVVDLDKPVMMILFGAGLLALVLMVVFLIIKLKSRASAKMTDDFDVEDDYSSDDTLLSDENGSIDLEAPVSADDEPENSDTPQKEADKNNNSINSPSDSASDVEAALNEKKQADSEDNAPKETSADISDDSNTVTEKEAETDEAQEAWDNAATTSSADESKDDRSVMDEWSKALDEQSENDKNVDLSSQDNKDSSQDDMASAWEAALNEQESAENKASSKTDDDSMADAWSAALNEQNAAENKDTEKKSDSPKSEEEAMADAWSAALNEQSAAENKETEKKTDSPKSEEEAMADAWSAALNEQSTAEKKDTEKKSDSPKSEEEAMADAWSAALNEQGTAEKKESENNTDPLHSEDNASDVMTDAHESTESEVTQDVPVENTSEQILNNEDNAETDSVLNETAALEDNTVDAAISADSAENKESQADDVKVEDISEDDLLNQISDNTEQILKENSLDTDSAPVESHENALAQEETQSEKESYSADDNVTSQDPQVISENQKTEETQNDLAEPEEQLSGEEKAFLDSMSDKSHSEDDKEVKEGTETEFENSSKDEIADDNIPDADAEVVSDEDIPAENKNTVGSNVDEVLNDDLNLEDLLSGNVVDAPEESETPEERADGAEVFDAIPEEEEQQSVAEESVAEESEPDNSSQNDSDGTESKETVEQDGAGTEDTDAEQSAFDNNQQTTTSDDLAEDRSANLQNNQNVEDAEASELEDIQKKVSPNEDIGDIQSKSEQAIFNHESKDDNSIDENGVVSWAVPDDDFDIVEKSKENSHAASDEPVLDDRQNDNSSDIKDAVAEDPENKAETDDTAEDDAKALGDLEQRLSLSKAQYDTGADEDIMNMLSGGVHDDLPHENEKAFTDDEIASMMSSANAVDPENIQHDSLDLDESSEDKSSESTEDEDHSLENVSDTIGPISSQNDDGDDNSNFDNTENTDEYEGLNSKQHQYYVDELNLARLYFETGDTEEALKIIDDVKEHGSTDLKDEASKIIETYGN